MSADINKEDNMAKRDRSSEVQPQVIQRPANKPTSGGAKVTVACNLPHGVRLRNFKMAATREVVPGGVSRDINVAEAIGGDVLIRGVATEVGKLSRAPIVSGYALTKGVDKEFWEAWLKDNKNSAMVINQCIFAYDKTDDAADAAEERSGETTGLEPLEIDSDPRRPQSLSRLVGDVEQADTIG